MSALKRLSVFLAIFCLLVMVSVSYKGNDVLNRAIVLGLGVDVAEQGLCVTAEVVSPGENKTAFSKTVSATGQTVAQALQQVSAKCGKEASLGQCVLLVLGESFCQTDFSSAMEFFVRNDSFKESVAVCCCQGSAKELLNKFDVLGNSVSLALSSKLGSLGKDVALPTCNLLKFARSQRELFQTGFLNYVTFQNSPNTNPDTQQNLGFFVCDRVAVFRANKMVGLLSEEETAGFAILDEVCGNTFAAVDGSGNTLTLRANSKQVNLHLQDGAVTLSVTMLVKLARNDSFGANNKFSAQTQAEVSKQMLQQATQQATRLAQLFLNKQLQWNFDLLNIHEAFRQKYGTTPQALLPMSEIPTTLQISVKEK